MTKQEFIKAIAAAAQKYAPKYSIKVVSPIIAQACLESGYGTSNKAKYHNYFGLKYRKDRVTCNSGYFSDGSQEQKADGTYIPITTDWYAFASLEAGVEGYFQFINCSLYSNLKDITDPKKYLETIKSDGYATSLNYVDNVYKVVTSNNLTQYDNFKEETKMEYTNSGLVNCKVMSPNHSGTRTHSIDRITPHCVVGQVSAERIGGCFTNSSRQASCNYGIGYDGRVCLVVDEANRSWCSSSSANDQRAITIEVASDKTEPYAFKDAAYNKLVDLCVDICKRNGKNKLLWIEDKNTALNYNPKSNEMLLTVHRWFANKSCPGNWMYERMGDLANKVNAKLGNAAGSIVVPTTPSQPTQTTNKNFPAVPFTVQVIVSDLNYRSEPSMNGAVKGVTGKGKFTITQISNGWGKLKSGAGWIYLENASYVTIGKTVAGSSSTASSTTATNKNYPTVPFTVQVIVSDLNIRKTPNGTVTGKYTGKGTFTIDQVQNGWGHLKSGAGWIYLENASYVTIGKTVAGSSSTASSTTSTASSYLVKVTADALNIRKGPGTNYGTNGSITNKGTYTIVQTKGNWGKLKSGAGWICLDYTKRV